MQDPLDNAFPISKPKKKRDYEKEAKQTIVHAFNGRELNFSSDDIRYFYKRLTGRSFRGKDEDCLNGIITYLIQVRKTL